MPQGRDTFYLSHGLDGIMNCQGQTRRSWFVIPGGTGGRGGSGGGRDRGSSGG